jgi:hypothetical protein
MRQDGAALDRRAAVDQLAVVARVLAQGIDDADDLRPTSTTSSGSTVPVALIVATRSPQVTGAVR